MKKIFDEENKSKHTALWCGLIFFFALIFCLWLFNIKNTIPSKNLKTKLNLESISKEFKDGLKEGAKKIEDFVPASSTNNNSNNETYEERQEDLFR